VGYRCAKQEEGEPEEESEKEGDGEMRLFFKNHLVKYTSNG